jgi:hypothetical protein
MMNCAETSVSWDSRLRHLCLQNIRIVLPSLDLTRSNPFCESVINRLLIVVNALRSVLKTSAELRLENVALRHQLGVLRRSAPKRLKMTATDRLVWVLLRRLWSDWKTVLVIVKPQTVVAWHRKGFRLFWTWKVRCGERGRPSLPPEIRDFDPHDEP